LLLAQSGQAPIPRNCFVFPHSAALSQRLFVHRLGASMSDNDWQRIMDRLREQAGRLRSEVAASINRKKVPLLAFHLLDAS
jgi:ribosome-binding factor A